MLQQRLRRQGRNQEQTQRNPQPLCSLALTVPQGRRQQLKMLPDSQMPVQLAQQMGQLQTQIPGSCVR